MQHHSIAGGVGMFNSVLFDPGLKQRFSFVAVA
jgi:hypothetical protein